MKNRISFLFSTCFIFGVWISQGLISGSGFFWVPLRGPGLVNRESQIKLINWCNIYWTLRNIEAGLLAVELNYPFLNHFQSKFTKLQFPIEVIALMFQINLINEYSIKKIRMSLFLDRQILVFTGYNISLI